MSTNVDTVTIERSGGDVPYDYTLGPTEAFAPQTVTGTFDGTGAGGDFKPTLSLYASNGALLGRWPAGDTVLAGGSAEVSWGPFLRAITVGGAAFTGLPFWAGELDLAGDGSRATLAFQSSAFPTYLDWDAGNNQLRILATGLYLVVAYAEWSTLVGGHVADDYQLTINALRGSSTDVMTVFTPAFVAGKQFGGAGLTSWDTFNGELHNVNALPDHWWFTASTSGTLGADVGALTVTVIRLGDAVAQLLN